MQMNTNIEPTTITPPCSVLRARTWCDPRALGGFTFTARPSHRGVLAEH